MFATEDQETSEFAFHAQFEGSVVLVLYSKPKGNLKSSLTLAAAHLEPEPTSPSEPTH